MNKLVKFLKDKREQGITFNKKPTVFPVAVMAISSLYVVIMYILHYNFLAPVAVALSIAVAVAVFAYAFFKGELNLYLLLSYGLLFFGTALLYAVFGAEGFFKGLGFNLMISSLSIAAFAGLIIVSFPKDRGFKYALSAVLAVVLICGTAVYFVFMSMRMRPTVKSLMSGHNEYLSMVEKMKASADSPNVLIILMDDMGYADTSCYSYLGNQNSTIKTPNIDSIANDGIIMNNFYSSSPVSSPSRFGMLTGRYPSRGYLDNVVFPSVVSTDPYCSTRYLNPYQFLNNVDGILGDEITFAEVFQKAGYKTGLIGKWNLGDYGEYLPTNQGFDYFYGSYYVNDMTPYNMVIEEGGKSREVLSHSDLKDQSATTRRLTDAMKNYIGNAADNNDKFMAYYCTPWPHYPIFSGETGNKADDNYIDCIEEFDSGLGEIFSLMKEKGVYDDTLIIFTSDNGPGREGAAGALRGRKNTVFDGGHKVPLVAAYVNGGLGKGAAFEESNVIETRSMNIDIFPTLLQYAGINILPADRVIDGKSLYGIWQGDAPLDTEIHDKLFFVKRGKPQGVLMPNVQTDNGPISFKYYDKVRTENSAFIDQVYKNYLFDLDSDPAEAYNVSMVYPDAAAKSLKTLEDFRKELKQNRRGIQ